MPSPKGIVGYLSSSDNPHLPDKSREPRHPPDHTRPPRQTHYRWLVPSPRSRSQTPLPPPPLRHPPLLHLPLPTDARNHRRHPLVPDLLDPLALAVPSAHHQSLRRAPPARTRFRQLPAVVGGDESYVARARRLRTFLLSDPKW